jgi:methylmalonyl-CoA mutase
VYDNCNSLHTNANDEAISLPTEESVRRALAIQMIIDKELGLAKNQNCLQGSFVIEELTDLLEEAVIREFDNLSKRGGVLGAMETMYQRSKIQEESMHYEMLKHSGELPLIGVNTFTNAEGSPTVIPEKVVRITNEEYDAMVESNLAFRRRNEAEAPAALARLRQAVLTNANVFECLMEVSKVCTLGQMTETLYEVGGEYRRNM